MPDSTAPQDSINSTQKPNTSQFLQIKIMDRLGERIFKLNLSNLDATCRAKIMESFEDKSYDIESLLLMLITNLRDKAMAEIEIAKILDSINNMHSKTPHPA